MAKKKPAKKRADKKTAKKAAKKTSAAGKKSSGKKPSKKRPSRKTVKRKSVASKASKKKATTKKPAKKKATTKKPAKKKATRKTAVKKATRKKATKKTARKAAPRKATDRRGKLFFDHFRRRLLEERERILTRLEDLRAELSGLQEMPRELEEWAQEEKDRDILIRLEEREATELRRIQAALERIDDGSYGKCQICDRPIPRDRLEELPTAFRCIDHTL